MRISTLLAVFLLPCLLLLPVAAGSSPPGKERSFGAALTLEETTKLGDIVASPERFADRNVLLRGRLTDLCTKKGCWTVLTDDRAAVRVTFQDYGFFLPQDALGQTALVEGRAEVQVLSEREARHYASESRNGDPDAIEGPQRQVGFVATGVRLLGAESDG